MSEHSNIEWTRSTFNPWWGCTKVGPGCDHCYAEGVGARFGTQWGSGAERRVFGDKYWNEPLRWEKKAVAEQTKDPKATWRVFCSSMADVFDNEAPAGQRERLWVLIEATPHLTWLLLTKRIGNAKKMLPAAWLEPGSWPKNVRLGITVVNQEEADRDIEKLLELGCPNFLSIEPLLGHIDLSRHLWVGEEGSLDFAYTPRQMLHWVIVGGESGNGARPMHPDWVRSLRDQCAAVGLPFLFKQWGEWTPGENLTSEVTGYRSHANWFDNEWVFGETNMDDPEDGWMDEPDLYRVGKKYAGRLLDGVQHDGYPEVRT